MGDRYLKAPDVWCKLAVAHSVKRALVRHFNAFLHQQIDGRGFSSHDPNLFNQDTIEGQAWELADNVIDNVKEEFAGIWEEVVEDVQGWAASALAEQVPEVEREYLANPLGELDMLIELASGAPPHFGGTGTINWGMGPEEPD
jgi:hypothetical protein